MQRALQIRVSVTNLFSKWRTVKHSSAERFRMPPPGGHKEINSRGAVSCVRYPVEVVEDVGGVSGSEAGRRHADDGHAVGDLHLLLYLRQVVRLVLPAGSGRHVAELHGAVVQPLGERREPTVTHTSDTVTSW
ncbi:hypothetical protein EYF80_042049 [Liparis tanakae]|uniref:Uncharacterized protein n=1 Tax=Liparis tanakae TaxID=230148 RepID=A0A4Z2G3J3_9TELE|nr:hypothetical protein EYF80_042049 [Liparis tanakae]